MRVLHVLHTSLPYVCGYSIRSDRILQCERELGIDVSAVTSAQQPDEAGGDAGTAYLRTPRPRLWPSPVREAQLMGALRASVARAAARIRPDIIHAHSPVLVGLPAYLVARRAGLPFVYEVRDLWENASVDRGKFAADSVPYRVARALETWLLRRADAVVAICDALRGDLATRCGEQAKLSVVPNGVDVEAFKPGDAATGFRQRVGLGAEPMLAYVGAFQPYEGLDLLVRAMGPIGSAMPSARLVVAGDGPERRGLEELAREAGVGHAVTFTGRIPHHDVASLYAAADVLVYPRVLTRTTALTTPLKPLEAMAMGRCVLASDVPAMREIVTDGVTGHLFHAGDAEDLVRSSLALLGDLARRATLGAAARAWVERERDWRGLTGRYASLYETLVLRSGREHGAAGREKTDGRSRA